MSDDRSMSRDDDDVNVPNLGPAEPVSGDRTSVTTEAQQPSSQTPPSSTGGGGMLQSLVSIILIVAVCTIGYFGFDMYQAQKNDETTFLKAQQQMEQLQQLIQQAEKGAEQSGEQLKGNVSSLESSLRDKDKKLDSEIAKLWAVSYQKNKPQIEKQAKELADLKKALAALKKDKAAQEKSLNGLKATVSKQAKQIKDTAQIKADTQKLKQSIQAEVTKLSTLIARVETDTRATNEFMQEQQAEMLQTQRELSDRIAKMEGRSTSDLERRVKLNEQAVRAFDSTRSQLSQDLLFVKQKLNNLQLMLEKK